MPRMNYNNFIDDEEKVNDLLYLNKEEFLKSYSYITEAEYENTINKIKNLIDVKIKFYEKQNKKRAENADKINENYRKYYEEHKDIINARRRAKKQQKNS